MRGDIALAGFFWTADEWDALDVGERALLLGQPPPPRTDDTYAAYEVVVGEPWRIVPIARAA